MTITKFGHCCLLLETRGKRILIDPGTLSQNFEALTGIDIILITHEHADHCHTESIASLLKTNPEAIVVTNTSVAALLRTLHIEAHILEGRDTASIIDVTLTAYDGTHVEIFEDYGIVQNTGYLVNDTFFFPGDAYTVPDKQVTILGMPVAGPWCKVSDAIRYCLLVAPKIAIPVHDATLSEAGKGITYKLCERELSKCNISWRPLEVGEMASFE